MTKFFKVLNTVGVLIHKFNVDDALGDFLLDKIEEFVMRTDNEIDDRWVLPAIVAIREALDIEDNDKPKLEVTNNEA